MTRIGDVELGEDMRHERREWIAQRVGWALMALLVGAALLGAFGSGPLARAHAAAEGIEVDYPRFGRHQAVADLDVRLAGGRLWIARDTLDRVDVQRITPPPLRVVLDGDRWVYEYAGSAPSWLQVQVRYRRIGLGGLRLGADGGGELRLEQLVYP